MFGILIAILPVVTDNDFKVQHSLKFVEMVPEHETDQSGTSDDFDKANISTNENMLSTGTRANHLSKVAIGLIIVVLIASGVFLILAKHRTMIDHKSQHSKRVFETAVPGTIPPGGVDINHQVLLSPVSFGINPKFTRADAIRAAQLSPSTEGMPVVRAVLSRFWMVGTVVLDNYRYTGPFLAWIVVLKMAPAPFKMVFGCIPSRLQPPNCHSQLIQYENAVYDANTGYYVLDFFS